MTSGCQMQGIAEKLVITAFGVTVKVSHCLSNKAMFSSSSLKFWADEAEGRAGARQHVIATEYLLLMLEQSLQMSAWKKMVRSAIIYLMVELQNCNLHAEHVIKADKPLIKISAISTPASEVCYTKREQFQDFCGGKNDIFHPYLEKQACVSLNLYCCSYTTSHFITNRRIHE